VPAPYSREAALAVLNGAVDAIVEGHCESRFTAVRDAFLGNFNERGEVGAAVAVVVDGVVVCDLWGGLANRESGATWARESLVDFYSAGKPVVATLLLRLIDEGRVDLDSPVAEYWPEFEQHGKGTATVRQALCHQAGVPAIRRTLTNEDLWSWDAMASALAETAPWFEPGSRHVYHTNTYGHLIGEMVRRVDGRLPGFVLRELNETVGADIFCGLGPDELRRCATVIWDSPMSPGSPPIDTESEASMIWRGYFNPPGYSSVGVVNSIPWRTSQVPSTNGHGTARGLARFYDALIGPSPVLSAALLAEATSAQSTGPCPVLNQDVTFGLGFQPSTPHRPFGPTPSSFGHFGTGGSVGFADPAEGVAFGYVMNHVIPRWQSTRNRALIGAVYDCLK